MTYEIELYFPTDDLRAPEISELVSSAALKRLPSLRVSALGVSELSWSGYLGDAESTLLELSCDPKILRPKIEDYAAEAPDGRLEQMNAYAKMTLIGDGADWPTVRAIWEAVDSLWPSIPYDEESGFDVSLQDIP